MTDKTGKKTGHSQSGQNNELKDKAKETLATATDEVKARAQSLTGTVATEAKGYANQAKGAAAGEIKGVASALRTAADELRSGSPQERTFSQFADGLADASDAMRDKDLGQMASAVSDFAKRNPMVFLGSAALIGFAASRFTKASGSGASSAANYGQQEHRGDHPSPTGRSRYSNPGNVQNTAVKYAQERSKV